MPIIGCPSRVPVFFRGLSEGLRNHDAMPEPTSKHCLKAELLRVYFLGSGLPLPAVFTE